MHTLLADPAEDSRVMGSNARLPLSGLAEEAIPEHDIDVPSFIASYDQVEDVQVAHSIAQITKTPPAFQSAFTMSAQVQRRYLLQMIVHT